MAKKNDDKEIEERIEELNEIAKAEEWEGLEREAERFIEDYPEHAAGYFLRGTIKDKLEQYEEAIKDYDEAIRLKPEHANAYNNRGTAKLALERFEEAIKDYNEAIHLNPNGANVYNNRGTAKQALEQYDEAIADYNEAIRLDQNDAAAYNNRGNVKQVQKRYEEAIRDYDRAISLDPQLTGIYQNKGVTLALQAQENVLEKTSNPNEIIKQYDKDINQSHCRLYGFPENGNDECISILCRIKTYFAKIIGRYPKTSPKPLKGSLANRANKAADRLRFWISGIVAVVSLLFFVDYFSFVEIYCYFGDICEIPRPYMPQAEKSNTSIIASATRYSLILIILTGAFFAYARRANREYKEELNRYFALKRDRNIMLYWTTISGQQKIAQIEKIFTHFSENSVADLSFQMLDPKLARQKAKGDDTDSGFFWQRDRNEKRRLDDMEKQLAEILGAVKAKPPKDTP